MTPDDIIEMIAADLESPNFGDMCGLLAKRKKDRENANLRFEVRNDQRKEIARLIRTYKSGSGNSYISRLERIEGDAFAWGPDVSAALAAGHAVLKISVELTTHIENCGPKFEVRLTDKGRQVLHEALK